MKAQKMVPAEAYLRLAEKTRDLRRAIKNQQKATLVWKARAMMAEERAQKAENLCRAVTNQKEPAPVLNFGAAQGGGGA